MHWNDRPFQRCSLAGYDWKWCSLVNQRNTTFLTFIFGFFDEITKYSTSTLLFQKNRRTQVYNDYITDYHHNGRDA